MKKFSSIAGAALLVAGFSTFSLHSAQAATCIKVKSAIGKNYQSAQDTWRAQGLVVMPAKDGKGWGRISWLDRNWKVIGQTPKAGTCVKKKSNIRATIVKYTDY
jgi:beta-lactam-binding protein with PASTA domain